MKTTSKKTDKYKVGHIKVRPISKAKFDKMTPAQKRVAIAKDVLARLDAGKIVQKRGEFLRPADRSLSNKIRDGRGFYSTPSMRELVESDGKTMVNENQCCVCAKGALVLSWAANFNEVTVGEIYQRPCLNPIDDVFPSQMRDAMEQAFENKKWSLRQVMSWIIEKKGNFHYDGIIYSDGEIDFWSDPDPSCPTRPPKNLTK